MKKYLLALLLFICATPLWAEWDPTKLQDWEKEAITEIFSTMAEKSVPALIFDTFRLTRLGESINHIPPLQFVGFLMCDPYLKDCIRSISTSYFKWPPFMDGVSTNMEKELAEGRLFSDLPYFAKLVGGDLETLKKHCERHRWEEFVKSLL